MQDPIKKGAKFWNMIQITFFNEKGLSFSIKQKSIYKRKRSFKRSLELFKVQKKDICL